VRTCHTGRGRKGLEIIDFETEPSKDTGQMETHVPPILQLQVIRSRVSYLHRTRPLDSESPSFDRVLFEEQEAAWEDVN
jgi:hypothetical protein